MRADRRRSRPAPSRRRTNWVVLAALVHRTLVNPIILAGGYEVLGGQAHAYLLIVAAFTSCNALLAVHVIIRGTAHLRRSTAFFAADLTVTVAANLALAALLPANTVLLPYRDVLWLYATSTAGLWTSLRGTRTGVVLLFAGSLLPAAMVLANRADVTRDGLLHLIARDGWLWIAILIPIMVNRMSRDSAARTARESRRAGRALERTRALRDLHDHVLQGLAQIGRSTAITDTDATSWREEVRQIAVDQHDQLRRAMQKDDEEHEGLRDALYALSHSFRGQLDVHLDLSRLTAEPAQRVAEALSGAVRESLRNTAKHSGVRAASVTAHDEGTSLRILIADQGRGFDPATAPRGFGLHHSITRRLDEIGGAVRVRTSPGAGTTIDIVAPLTPTLAKHPHHPGGTDPGRALGEHDATDSLTRQAIAWFALAALAYRIALSPLQAMNALANLNLAVPILYSVIVAAVLVVDLTLLSVVLAGRFAQALRSRLLLGFDLTVTVAMNLWAAHVLPTGSELLPGRDILWTYAVGVVAFWTVLRGIPAGIALVLGGVVLQIAMAALNHAALTSSGWAQLASRQGWLLSALLLAWLATTIARNSARKAVAQGIHAGRAIEHAWTLRDMYAGVEEALRQIIAHCDAPELSPEHQARQIRGTALTESARLRAAMNPAQPPTQHHLASALARCADAARSQGLRVELVDAELSCDTPEPVARGMAAAVDSFLADAAGVGRTSHVVLRASTLGRGVEVTVRERPSDADACHRPLPDPQRYEAALTPLGGHADLRETPDGGTRLRLQWTPAPLPAQRARTPHTHAPGRTEAP